MAAYASTVTLHTDGAERISRNLGIVAGKIDITNYNSTTTEETDITKYFVDSSQTGIDEGIMHVSITPSENGYVWQFDKTTGKFKVYYSTVTATVPLTDADNAASAGVAVYFDEDATAGSRLLFVSPTNASGTETLTVTAAALTEVADDTDVGTADFVAIGLIK